jgi:hypothetical protein
MRNFEQFNTIAEANVSVKREDTGEVLYEAHNVIVNVSKWLFARLMANVNPNDPNPPYQQGHEALYGIWGLAFGAGDPSWAPETQPDPTPAQTQLVAQFLRKKLSRVNFVDSNQNPLNTLSTIVDFQTTINATTDNISQAIREMGLIGGGTFGSNPPSTQTDMQQAPYFNPSAVPPGPANSVVLINYLTLPPLILPPGVNIIISWVLAF